MYDFLWHQQDHLKKHKQVIKSAPCQQSLSLTCLILAYSRKTAGIKQVRSLLSMHYMLLGYNFKPRPTSRALDIAGSGMTKRMPLLEKPVWREKTRLTCWSSACGLFKGLMRFNKEDDKRRFCSQVVKSAAASWWGTGSFSGVKKIRVNKKQFWADSFANGQLNQTGQV